MPFVLAAARRQGTSTSRSAGGDDAPPRIPAARQAVLHRFEPVSDQSVEGVTVEGVVDDPEDVVDLVLDLVRTGEWVIGVGAGPAVGPLPRQHAPTTELARQALEAARRRPQQLAVLAADRGLAADADAVLTLLAALVQRRSPAAWQAVDLVTTGASTTEAAARLGVSRQAVGQRLAAGLWAQEQRARPTAARLLGALTCQTGPHPGENRLG